MIKLVAVILYGSAIVGLMVIAFSEILKAQKAFNDFINKGKK